MATALLVIDVQNDFYAGGALAASDTESLLRPLNDTIDAGLARRIPCIFSRDWHPPTHRSFAAQGGPWPPHCVRDSHGAHFVDGLIVPPGSYIVDKGIDVDDVSYSMFDRTGLTEYLNALAIDTIAACGIATEYCILDTVRAAVRLGLKVTVLVDLIRAVEALPGDAEQALAHMRHTGATLITSGAWLDTIDSARR